MSAQAISMTSFAGGVARERRYAEDGRLYTYGQFVDEYSGKALFMWECALPQDMGQAREKVTSVVRAYKAVCWRRGLDVDDSAAAEPEPPNEDKWRHFDFVEVGTSDWGTLTQFCAGKDRHDYVSWLGADIRTSISDPRWARGLAVEPVKAWLDALPKLPRVTKVEAAMGERSGEATL